jgi:YbbR domain-containing protein
MKKQSSADRGSATSHWLAGAFQQNWRVKVISLLLAVGFVAFHRGQRDDRLRTVSVGLVWHTPPEHENRELMTRMPSEVHVTLRGPRKTLEDLLETGVPPITLDLRTGSQQRVNLDPEMFSFPPGLEVKIIDPSGIDLKWEDVIERSIPIQSSLTGIVAQGFETGSVSLEPTLIGVRGPRSVVDAMQSARLAPFDVTGLSGGSYSRQIALDPPPSRVGYLDADCRV